eukprot:351253-Chlamydomonas_euryale.AAC.7
MLIGNTSCMSRHGLAWWPPFLHQSGACAAFDRVQRHPLIMSAPCGRGQAARQAGELSAAGAPPG